MFSDCWVLMPLKARCRTGLSNKTFYTEAWKDMQQHMDLHASNTGLWQSSRISMAARRQTLRARYGVLHNMRQAFKYKMPYLPGLPIARNICCPLCGQNDSATHILNACGSKAMKALYIERHNSASRMILQEVLRGGRGNAQIFADIGSDAKMLGLGCFETRLTTLLTHRDMANAGLTIDDRAKMRPDILLIENKRKKSSPQGKAHIVEVGYTQDLECINLFILMPLPRNSPAEPQQSKAVFCQHF